ncbi:MAG: hypothetical protein SGI88_06060 [Candidatus Hydrogenedentes bacterium]|nr:hypothetical protein [Candidatus Hydrogenedentota bacterium]
MRSVHHTFGVALIALAGLGVSGVAYGQDEIEVISPEPGDAPVAVEIEVTPAANEAVEVVIEGEVDVSTPGVLPSPLDSTVDSRPTLEQRVDDTNTNEAIRVAPRSRKNVYRLDNLPNKPRIKPIAVIQGPVSPWGYSNRYINGEINRQSAKEMQGKAPGPGSERQGGLTGGSNNSSSGGRGGGSASARRNRD